MSYSTMRMDVSSISIFLCCLVFFRHSFPASQKTSNKQLTHNPHSHIRKQDETFRADEGPAENIHVLKTVSVDSGVIGDLL